MRVLVTGSRKFTDYERILEALRAVKGLTCVIHGCQTGADTLAGRAALELGVNVMEFPADWERHGDQAGPIRNQEMLRVGEPDWVFAFPLFGSRGTWDMVNKAYRAKLSVRIFR